MRRNPRRRGDRAQQAVDAQANHEPGAERLDVDVAGAQLDGALQHVVERAHDRRAAGEIAQAFDVVVGLLARCLQTLVRRRAIVLDALVQYGGDVLEGGDRNLDRFAEHDLGGANGCGIGGIGDREAIAAVRRAEWKDRGLAEETTGESVETWCRSEQLGQTDPHHAEIVRDFVGEFRRRQVGRLPQLAQGTRQG